MVEGTVSNVEYTYQICRFVLIFLSVFHGSNDYRPQSDYTVGAQIRFSSTGSMSEHRSFSQPEQHFLNC